MFNRKIDCLGNACEKANIDSCGYTLEREANFRVRVIESRESEYKNYKDFTLGCIDCCGITAVTTNTPNSNSFELIRTNSKWQKFMTSEAWLQ
jgi:hypothetical protein